MPGKQRHETARQRQLLETQVGLKGSGALRYGAAMFFYQERLMSAELLEIYRMCSKFDGEDPLDVAAYEGVRLMPDVAPEGCL